MSELLIPLSPKQAETLTTMLAARATADREVVLYAGAIIAGSEHPNGGNLSGVRAGVDGGPAMLVLTTPD